MKKVTAKQKTRNCEIALYYWKSVPEGNVANGLNHWGSTNSGGVEHTCGTIACFGGWLIGMPEFIAMGVRPEAANCFAPTIVKSDGTRMYAHEVCDYLFGSKYMFEPNNKKTWHENLSDHAEVTRRLQERIEHLKTHGH